MADTGGPDRVKRMRQARKAKGEVETNVWIPKEVRAAIERSVAEGVYQTRRRAIVDALTKVFLPAETTTR